MAIDRTNWTALVDDTGDNLSGTLWTRDKVKTVLLDPIDAEFLLYPKLPASTAPTTTGTQTALAIPSGTGDLVLYLNNATLLTIQGIVAGAANQVLTLISVGAGQVDIAHLHASGTALGKVHCFATSGLTSLAAGSGVVRLRYDQTNTKWRLVEHEQGAWITPTFAAGNFTGNGAMTWTLDAGDVILCRYRLNGRTLLVSVLLATLSVGGTPNTELRVGSGAYGGFVATVTSVQLLGMVKDNGAALASAYVTVVAGGTNIAVSKLVAGNFTASTNLTEVYFDFAFEVN